MKSVQNAHKLHNNHPRSIISVHTLKICLIFNNILNRELKIILAYSVREQNPGNISIAAAFDDTMVFCLPSDGDLRFLVARLLCLPTVPGVTDVIFDARDGGGGDRCEDILESVAAASACSSSTASSFSSCLFFASCLLIRA
jgi:hypothetical protein